MTPPRAEPDERSDHDLVGSARSGDRAALETLLRRHHDRIRTLCHRLCRDRGDAEDATQEALIAVVRGLDRFDGRSAFTTWSYRVATNACLDELRRRGRRPLLSDDPDLALEQPSSAHAAASDPAEAALAGEQRGELQRALAMLPEDFRWPVVLRDLAELDYAEIAELLGLAPGTVRSRISRGRARLAELLTDQAGPAGNRSDTVDVSQDEP
ncbi:MAG: RNA polymerase sigma factor [Microthrixaceae bacterium]